MVRAGMIAAFALVFSLACETVGERQERLIPPGDDDFEALEMPEMLGECVGHEDCDRSCVDNSCTPVPEGPVTCPSEPPPIPPRVADAACLCNDSICAWYE